MNESESTGHVDPFATERSFEVEDLSSPESPPINYNQSCLEPDHFEPYVHANYPLNTHLTSLSWQVLVFTEGRASRGGSWWKWSRQCHHPPAQPIAKFDCNSQVLAHRGQSLSHFHNKICQIENLWRKSKELEPMRKTISYPNKFTFSRKRVVLGFWYPLNFDS